MIETMDYCDGKYTVINDNGTLTTLRHGEPWVRDITGDNLVYWMFVKTRELQEERDQLLEDNKTLKRTLAASCDEEREQLYEAGPGGGCSRALSAEFKCDAFKEALIDVLRYVSPVADGAIKARDTIKAAEGEK